MIEIVKERELEPEEKNTKLPKNIRQIGERDNGSRIYLEDYVITYLRQMTETADDELKVLILYGRKEIIEFMPTWFVSGVLETEYDSFLSSNLIDEHEWHSINEKASKFFPDLSVLGWAVIGEGDIAEHMERIELTWRQFFREDQQLFFYASIEEKTEDLYCFDNGQLKRQKGYYIYYEKKREYAELYVEHTTGTK